ncbi:hypothetical protein AXI64_gp012 [Vibrio phage qdvp001]|uniref:hypothetical protein n=1 Tax=Vibrio phage qdvp001 TaxID=1003177 RepID=UPI0007207C16|nr:hypothetical protein AXI64_gp012 [Vibrio phage qdvp001]ALM62004.1 hypothetical protein qdvp001_012 [Vibrio phage qdvp001]
MIKTVDNLRKCYAVRADKEVFELFMNKCEEFGVVWAGVGEYPRDCRLGEAVVFSGADTDKLTHGDESRMKQKGYKRLTLSDLKPRTKTVYEKVEFNHAWELVKQFELYNDILYKSSSTPTYELMSIENIQNMLCNEYPVSLYRKVEKEIDWREVSHGYLAAKTGFHWSTPVGEVINDESDCFLDLCRTALRATGELE